MPQQQQIAATPANSSPAAVTGTSPAEPTQISKDATVQKLPSAQVLVHCALILFNSLIEKEIK